MTSKQHSPGQTNQKNQCKQNTCHEHKKQKRMKPIRDIYAE